MDALADLESGLASLARSGGPLRAAIALAAARLVEIRAPEALGYARLSDYARERLGQAGRTVYEWAQVGAALARAPRLARTLANGELSWTKVRALARLGSADEIEAWLPLAAKHTAASLDREVRRVAHCVESVADEDHEPREPIALVCTPRVRGKWHYAVSLARQTAGFNASPAACAEMIAAEVLSALEPDESFRTGDPEDARQALRAEAEDPESSGAPDPAPDPVDARAPASDLGPGSQALERLTRGLDAADARELDRRLRDWISREQRLDAEIGARLAVIARRHLYRALGHASLDAYARERLGIDPAKARALLRVERAAVQAPELAAAYRSGALSWVAATALVPVILADSPGRFAASWVARAAAVTVRQLRDDVERALLVLEADPELWVRTGGLPERLDASATPPAAATPTGQEIGARVQSSDGTTQGTVEADGWIRLDTGTRIDPVLWKLLDAPDAPEARRDTPGCAETATLRFLAPVSVARLFRAVHACVQRGLAKVRGQPVTPGDALEAMLDHVIIAWDRRVTTGYRIYASSGWRCAVPGCSSRQSLHDHHILFRSAGGDDAFANRVALCAFHHLRGVHARLIRITGEAPHRLRFELPLETFVSGDLRYPSRPRLRPYSTHATRDSAAMANQVSA